MSILNKTFLYVFVFFYVGGIPVRETNIIHQLSRATLKKAQQGMDDDISRLCVME
jgi:hypothetical protein